MKVTTDLNLVPSLIGGAVLVLPCIRVWHGQGELPPAFLFDPGLCTVSRLGAYRSALITTADMNVLCSVTYRQAREGQRGERGKSCIAFLCLSSFWRGHFVCRLATKQSSLILVSPPPRPPV